MSGYRLASGGALIDRDRPLGFTFDGRRLTGYAGDTLASALLASGARLVGRSFKYHRPRGIVTAGPEEPNALVTLGDGPRAEPNTRATMVELFDGLTARSQNRWPSLGFDIMAVNGLLSPLFVAGFYYKTFMGPTRRAWMLYERFIRRAAGLGAGSTAPDPDRYETAHAFCDVLVVGAGPAGLMAALAAARSGARVILADENARLGGALIGETAPVGAASAHDWAAATVAELARLGVTLMPRTTVYGYYDGNTLGAVERVADHLHARPDFGPRQRHWTIRAREVVLATGAIERPVVFAGNDLPGVMLADAVRRYALRHGVAAGRRIAIFATNDGAYRTAIELHDRGVTVAAVIDVRTDVADALRSALDDRGIPVHAGHAVVAAEGGRGLRAVSVAPWPGGGEPREISVDTLAVSGGWTPTIHLASQAGGAPVFDEGLHAFLPGAPRERWRAAGACAGTLDLADCLASGATAGAEAARAAGFDADPPALPMTERAPDGRPLQPLWEVRTTGGAKSFVDLQHDVTAEDVRLAHREGFVSVEHLKRYTTLGMATDQGKTSNLTGLAILAAERGQSIPEVGTTRFRPPYTPVAIGALAGRAVGAHFRPVRRTPMHDWHVEHGAEMVAVGAWLRPRAYLGPGETVTEAYVREARAVRQGVGIVDVSTLGKIDVQGPDAAEFLNRVYANGFAKLPVGKARYGVMLRPDGFVFDDGTTWRLSETRYLMTTTTANAAAVLAHLEFVLATWWPDLKVQVASVTDQWAGMAVAGPLSRSVLRTAIEDVDFETAAFPHMGVREGSCRGARALVARLSFSGELAYEVYVPAHHGLAVWRKILEAGAPHGIVAYGTEAMGALRIEKGHVTGAELDGRTTLADVGLGGLAAANKAYVGRALMARPALTDPGRLRLVGLRSLSGEPVPTGAQVVSGNGRASASGPSLGHVTASTYSPALGTEIALALVERGPERHGDDLVAADPLRDRRTPVEVVPPCFYDAEGERMRV